MLPKGRGPVERDGLEGSQMRARKRKRTLAVQRQRWRVLNQTSIGLMVPAMLVKPTMSEKKMVTVWNSSITCFPLLHPPPPQRCVCSVVRSRCFRLLLCFCSALDCVCVCFCDASCVEASQSDAIPRTLIASSSPECALSLFAVAELHAAKRQTRLRLLPLCSPPAPHALLSVD